MKLKSAQILYYCSLFLVFTACSPSKEKQNELSAYSTQIDEAQLNQRVISRYPNGNIQAENYSLNTDSSTSPYPVKEIHYYDNEKKQVEGTLKNQQRHGLWTFYFENGNIWSQGHFKNGKSEGVFKIYNKDGSLKIKSYYKDGKKYKEDYFEKGKLKQSTNL